LEYEWGKKEEYRADEVLREFAKDLIVACIKEERVDYVVEEKEVHNRHDKGYKYFLSIKKNFIELIKTFSETAWDEKIREEDVRLMDKEFITVGFDKRESDLIYEIKVKNEKAYFVLLEIQSKPDRKMAYRLLNYMVEVWRKCELTRSKGKKFILPKIIPCVLYAGKERWSVPVEFKELYSDIKNEEYLVNFKYILIDVNRYKPDELAEVGNVIASAFYLDTAEKAEVEKRLEKLADVLKDSDKKSTEEFVHWAANMFVFNDTSLKMIEEKFVKGEEEMMNLTKAVKELCEDYEEAGRQQGIKQGRGEERAESVIRILSKKFKENNKIKSMIKNASKEKIEELENKIFEITSWEDVEDILKRR